jgi:hypothetical protein
MTNQRNRCRQHCGTEAGSGDEGYLHIDVAACAMANDNRFTAKTSIVYEFLDLDSTNPGLHPK